MDTTYETLDYSNMQERIDKIASELKTTLIDLKKKGKKVWGYGAPAKATMMLNYCGIDAELIGAVVDSAPAKIGKFIPGTGIQIRSVDNWLEAQPDYTCIFAWTYAQAIAHRHARDYKGVFFTPYILPQDLYNL